MLWPELGSGKFGTPCERMQLANLRNEDATAGDCGPPLDAASLELPVNPHPASASPQPTATNAQPARQRR